MTKEKELILRKATGDCGNISTSDNVQSKHPVQWCSQSHGPGEIQFFQMFPGICPVHFGSCSFFTIGY